MTIFSVQNLIYFYFLFKTTKKLFSGFSLNAGLEELG